MPVAILDVADRIRLAHGEPVAEYIWHRVVILNITVALGAVFKLEQLCEPRTAVNLCRHGRLPLLAGTPAGGLGGLVAANAAVLALRIHLTLVLNACQHPLVFAYDVIRWGHEPDMDL